MSRVATSLTICDPLYKYQSLVATGVYSPDLAQLRLAHHLQKLYLRLKDYSPASEYQSRLQQIAQAVRPDDGKKSSLDELAVESHPIWRNPLFNKFFRKAEARDSLALTRVLTSHQAALHINSPKGLFLSGDVGIGKSLLLDLLADGLPTSRKRRWHFNTFMLYTFSRLEHFRKSRPQLDAAGQEYSLLWMAKELIEESPILFLDEFQLPDKAASKILNNLFIAFFQLGGVLVASSNRMPEELEKATGAQYSPPATGGLIDQVIGLGKRHVRGELFGRTSDFAAFLEVLKSRCDFWHMEGARDWRREKGAQSSNPDSETAATRGVAASATASFATLNGTSEGEPSLDHGSHQSSKPAMYFLSDDTEGHWDQAVASCFSTQTIDLGSLQQASLIVYGRKILVPKQRDGISYWKFDELVHCLGPADYISLAANFHTFIIDRVPALTVMMKNEARRFITFLDALYEARCKLVVRAEANPDNLFFPEMRRKLEATRETSSPTLSELGDATYSETIAEIYQDQVSPFRPNISTYTDSAANGYNSDQDSDFGSEPGRKIDFGNTGAFTGEDERFAYKRAASRLWELCSAQWHARDGDWWQPLRADARHWEGKVPSTPLSKRMAAPLSSEISMGPSAELEEPVGLQRFSVQRLRDGAVGEKPGPGRAERNPHQEVD